MLFAGHIISNNIVMCLELVHSQNMVCRMVAGSGHVHVQLSDCEFPGTAFFFSNVVLRAPSGEEEEEMDGEEDGREKEGEEGEEEDEDEGVRRKMMRMKKARK